MAQELGLFSKYGLRVELKRELGWATIRDKIIYHDLDAAHAVAGMPFAATLGVGSPACDCLTGLVLNQHGNAITITNDLWKIGVCDSAALREEIIRRGPDRLLTFGIVSPFSSHNFLLRDWLSKARINPERQVQIVVVPPPQMVTNLKAGHLDGFCVGEPWNSVATQSGIGRCLVSSAQLAPGHPEKVLMTRRDFAQKHPTEHLALVAATLEACAFCQQPANHNRVSATLARSEYVGVQERLLLRGIKGELLFGGKDKTPIPDFTIFHSANANEPSADKAAWVLQHLRASGRLKDSTRVTPALGQCVFRTDIFHEAAHLAELPLQKATRNDDVSCENKLVAA